MSRGEQAPWLPSVAALVGERLGLHYPRDRWPDLERCIDCAAHEVGIDDTQAFALRLMGSTLDERQLEVLAHALTVGETYFFRERRSFEILEQEILPPLIAARRASGRSLRFWSAGCCTGEEPYSLAIVLDRLLPQREDWHVTILATDVNPRVLRSASRGEFGAWSFREAPPGLKERYFTAVGPRRFAIARRIRQMVTFAHLNLAEPCYPAWRNDTHSMDVILCRNVLMYLSPPLVSQVLGRFQRALADGGWLSVSATEAPVRHVHSMAPVHFDGATFHRKSVSPVHTPDDLCGVEEPPSVAPPSVAGAAPCLDAPVCEEEGGVDLVRLARTHADAGRLDLALEAIENAVVADKLDAVAHHLHAVLLLELGRVAPAREALQRAIYVEPRFVLAHHALGQIALRQGRGAEAERHFGNTLALLAGFDADTVLPHSGGLAVGHLRAMIEATAAQRRTA